MGTSVPVGFLYCCLWENRRLRNNRKKLDIHTATDKCNTNLAMNSYAFRWSFTMPDVTYLCRVGPLKWIYLFVFLKFQRSQVYPFPVTYNIKLTCTLK